MLEMEEISISDTYLVSIKKGILYIVPKLDSIVDIEVAVAIIDFRKKIQQGKAMLVFLDIRNLGTITKEAREYTSGKEVEGLDIAMAIITSSLSTKLLANFFIKFNRPINPTKMFTTENDALLWLEGYR